MPPGFELSDEFDFTAPATADAPGHLLLDVNLPPAGPKESARELLARTDQSLREIPGVRHVLVLSGQPFDRDRDQPCLVVGLAQVDGAAVDRERILREIRTRFIATEKSASIRTRDLSGYARSRSAGYPIEFAIYGFDRQPLRELANKVVAKMSREPRLTDAWAGPRQVPTYAVDIDRAKDGDAGPRPARRLRVAPGGLRLRAGRQPPGLRARVAHSLEDRPRRPRRGRTARPEPISARPRVS